LIRAIWVQENNIGIIRVPPEATVEIGGDLVVPGRGSK